MSADLFEQGYELKNIEASAYDPEELDRYLDELSHEISLIHDIIEEKKEKTMSTTGITCGKCHEKHSTPAEVAACYGVQRKTSSKASTPLVKEYQNSTSQWFETKQEAIKFLKGLGDVTKGMRPAKNGHGFWVWMKKS